MIYRWDLGTPSTYALYGNGDALLYIGCRGQVRSFGNVRTDDWVDYIPLARDYEGT